jgi:hypothetical protein
MPARNADRPLTLKEATDIRVSFRQGLKYLKLDPSEQSPERVQNAIALAIRAIARDQKKVPKKMLRQVAVRLGCVWGHVTCAALNWEWRFVTIEGAGSYVITNPDRSFVIAPMDFVLEQLNKRAPEENTSRLLFRMLRKGTFPGGEPGSYTIVG